MNVDDVTKGFDALGRQLEYMTVDFYIVDDDVIQAAKITDSCIHIGSAAYHSIIISKEAFIPQVTQNILDCFAKSGGKVLHSPSNLTPVIQLDREGLRAMQRKAENAEIFILFREKGDSEDYRIYLPSSSGYLLDLATGELQHFEAENCILKLSLALGETAVILLTNEALRAEEKREFRNRFEIQPDFQFSKELELICDENGFEIIKHSDKSTAIRLGDWSYLACNAYSGSGVYETTFTLPEDETGEEGEIDLGDVRFSAQVYLNNCDLGTAYMSPYKLKIPAGILDTQNKLKIVVTNTSANWYVHTDYFDRWNIKELSPYFEAELNYAGDLLSGGLYGPVVLYTECSDTDMTV